MSSFAKGVPWVLSGALASYCTAANASIVTYTELFYQVESATIGSSTYGCSNNLCPVAEIVATADSKTVDSFNIPGGPGYGAYGFINKTLLSVTAYITLLTTDQKFVIELNPSELYVSVDQENGGAGFGSSYGPTYPIATYDIPVQNYNLDSNFHALGYSPFNPPPESPQLFSGSGFPLYSTSGQIFELGEGGPSLSSFGSIVPESSTWLMMLFGFSGLGYASYRRARTTRV
jgi:hypothetical protein